MGGREKVSIHCPPVASFFSSPQGHAFQSQMSRMARERLSSVERRWAPSDRCGMGTRRGGPHISVELGSRFHHEDWVCISGARGSITQRQSNIPSGCCCLSSLGEWSVGSWSPERERAPNPASQAPSEVERANQALTQGEVAPPSAVNRPPLLCQGQHFSSPLLYGPASPVPQGQHFHHCGPQRLWFWVRASQSGSHSQHLGEQGG